ncbi:hypothetical protein LTR10_024351 [Elasticomyces elasticus]|nr:hypothetical protein LTR10_024351 [Elasticomyces elasticus]
MCGSCKRKNKKVGECDGVFSRVEFDSLQAQRDRALQGAEEKDKELDRLLAAVEKTRKEKAVLQARAQQFRDQQSQMLSRELAALDDIDAASPSKTSVAIDNSFDWNQVLQLEFEKSTSLGQVYPLLIFRR